MSKKVCILTSVHPPFDSRIFHKEAKSLAKAGYDVTLIAQHDEDETVDGVEIVALPKPKNRFRRMLGIWRVSKLAYRQKAGVYHLHDPELLPVGLLLKLLTKGKVIYDVHEDCPEAILSKQWLPQFSRWPIAKLFNLFEKAVSILVDCVITATDDIREKFKTAKTISIKNYPLMDSIFANAGRKRALGEKRILIYAGSLGREHGVEEIVESLGFLDAKSNVSLKFLGRFEGKGFEQEVRSLPEFAKVEYLGWQNREEVMKNLMEADIGLAYNYPLPRYKVGISTKLLEYMSIGLPVIAPNYPVWAEIVEGNNCGLTVDPLNPREIAKAVEYLLEHPDEARKMGENGRKAVVEKYNWETESRKLIAVYEDLLKGR